MYRGIWPIQESIDKESILEPRGGELVAEVQESRAGDICAILTMGAGNPSQGEWKEKAGNALQIYHEKLESLIQKTSPVTKKVPREVPYIPIPKNLGGPNGPRITSLRPKISPIFLESGSMKTVIGWLVMMGAWAMIEMDIALLDLLWWYREKFALSYDLKWNSWVVGDFSLYDIFAYSALWLVSVGTTMGLIEKYAYTRNIGKYSKIVMDYKNHTIHCHVQRNLLDLQKRGYFGIGEEMRKILPELVDELYNSGKIHELDTIVLDSYLLMDDAILKRLRQGVEKIIPYGEIRDVSERPIDKYTKLGLGVQNMREKWIRYAKDRDTVLKKILAPLVCSDKFGLISTIWAAIWHNFQDSRSLRWIVSFFPSKKENPIPSKKIFTHTRGFAIKLPKECPDSKNHL